MKVIQSTIERLLYITLFLVFVVSIATYIKLTRDDAHKFKVLKSNQEALICIVKGFTVHQVSDAFINKCVEENQ